VLNVKLWLNRWRDRYRNGWRRLSTHRACFKFFHLGFVACRLPCFIAYRPSFGLPVGNTCRANALHDKDRGKNQNACPNDQGTAIEARAALALLLVIEVVLFADYRQLRLLVGHRLHLGEPA
jgi:hypothetical protein